METTTQRTEIILKSKSFRGQKLTKFPNISKWKNCELIQFDDNPIENFTGLISMPDLKNFSLNNTMISSFLNAPELPSLERISLKMTPLGSYKTIDLMCTLVFGKQLMYVNGEEITLRQKNFADKYRDYLLPYFRQGWVLTSIKPIRFIHYQTRARITIKVPANYNKSENDQNLTEENHLPYTGINETNNENIDNTSNKSGFTIYEDETEEEDQVSLNEDDLMAKTTINNLSRTMAKGNPEETYLDQIKKKQKNKMLMPSTMRQIVRKPGGAKPLFEIKYPIRSPKKPSNQQNATANFENTQSSCPSP